jgi:hypothetical protein
VAYHLRKFKPAEINYDVQDKEMLAIVTAFKEWEHMLKSVAGEITVYTDHKNLEYFCHFQGADQTASALVRAPRRVQF